jgi:hypothetical protein
VGLLASRALGERRRRLEYDLALVHAHVGNGAARQVDICREAQGTVQAGGGQEDDVAGDWQRLLASVPPCSTVADRRGSFNGIFRDCFTPTVIRRRFPMPGEKSS